MKFTKIALAAVVTLVAAQAQATTVYLAGASATAANVRSALVSLCSGTKTTITYTGALTANITKASNLFAVKCSVPFTGLGSVDVVSFNVDGGSFTALTTSVGNDTAQFLDETNLSGVAGTAPTLTANATTLIAARQSEGGFLDIDAAAFPADQFTTFAIPDGTATEQAKYSQVFGVAVSPDLYTALQTSQGLTGCGVDSFTAACQPTISKAQYASIVSNAFNSAKTKGANFLVSTLANPTKLTVCRRVSTSGTQASSNAFFLNYFIGGDGTAAGAASPANAADDSTAIFDVIENGTTGDARTCLSNTGYAVGVLSLENYPNTIATATGSNADRKYRFVKLNGVAAFNSATNSLETAKDGSYEFFFNAHKFGATANGTAVLTKIDNQLGSVNLKGLFGIPAGSNTSTAKRDSNTSPITFN
jgi:hypothetical protein